MGLSFGNDSPETILDVPLSPSLLNSSIPNSLTLDSLVSCLDVFSALNSVENDKTTFILVKYTLPLFVTVFPNLI